MWLFQLAQDELVRRAVVSTTDGLVIEAAGTEGPSPEFLAAEIAAIRRAFSGLEGELGEGTQRFVVTLDKHELLVVCAGEFCVGALIKKRAGPGRRRVGEEITRVASRIAKELGAGGGGA